MWLRLKDEIGDPRLGADIYAEADPAVITVDTLNALINENTRTDTSENWIIRLNGVGVLW